MAYIRTVATNDATGKLANIYSAAQSRAGIVANIIRVMSLDARSVSGSMALYTSVMKTENALKPEQREMLAAVVSNVNDCFY